MRRPPARPGDRWALHRETPPMSLRISTTAVYRRTGSELPTSARVEWAGRVGHPSSYGLLAGHRHVSAGVAVLSRDVPYRRSLAGMHDDVRGGLPDEYEQAVADVVLSQPVLVVVDGAAHGAIGSSVVVFRALALLLCRLLATGVPATDAEIWALRDRCWSQAGAGR